MDLHLLFDNLTNPALLFFFLGILATQVKSDLEIPPNSAKFISIYLLFSIGFKGGQELSHNAFTMEILWSLLFGIFLAVAVPVYAYFILRRKFSFSNSGAIAASYGSVSAVTFVTAISFLEMGQIPFGGCAVIRRLYRKRRQPFPVRYLSCQRFLYCSTCCHANCRSQG